VIREDLGFIGILSAFLVSAFVNFFLVFWASRKYLSFRISFNWTEWKSLLKESLPMGISVFVTFLYFKMDTIFLSILKGSADVGIYSVAYKVIENLTFFPAMAIGLIFPLLSRFIFTNHKEFESIANKTFKIFLILVVPLVIGSFFLAEEITRIIGGEGFSGSGSVLRILAFALGFIFFGNFFNNILIAGGLQKKMMWILSGCAIFNISFNLILIPLFSYRGAAFTSVATELMVTLLTFWVVKKNLNYTPKVVEWTRIAFSGIVMAAALFLLRGTNLFLAASIGTTLYFLFLWTMNTITNDELRSIFSSRPVDQSDIIVQ
jgi:O-antigen/teichoic acid export membrane protein